MDIDIGIIFFPIFFRLCEGYEKDQLCLNVVLRLSRRDQEKSSSGKKFESPKKSNFFPLELFSSNFFLVHIELEVLQRWQTTHFKACSKS